MPAPEPGDTPRRSTGGAPFAGGSNRTTSLFTPGPRPIDELVAEALERLTSEQLGHLAAERRRRESDPEAGAAERYAADIAENADPGTTALFQVPSIVDAWRGLGIDDDIIACQLYIRLLDLGIPEDDVVECLHRITDWLPPSRRFGEVA